MSTHLATVKTRVAAISIFASAGMAATKFVVGIAIGSLALISEALHSSVDLVATVIPWLVVRVSDQPADEEHHYGHGKIESLSALGVIALLYVLAGGIVVQAWSHLRDGAPPRCIVPHWTPGARRWKPTRCILPPTCSDRARSSLASRYRAWAMHGAM